MTKEIELKEKTFNTLKTIQTNKVELEKQLKIELDKENILIVSLFEQNNLSLEGIANLVLEDSKIKVTYQEIKEVNGNSKT